MTLTLLGRQRDPEPVVNALVRSAEVHASTSNGMLTLLDYNPDRFDFHRLSSFVASTSQRLANPDALGSIAASIRPGYDDVFADLTSEESASAIGLSHVVEAAKVNQNTNIGYEHGESVLSFIVGAAALSNALRASNEGLPFRSGVMMSKMIDYLGLNIPGFDESIQDIMQAYMEDAGVEVPEDGVVPARNILSRVFDFQFLTIPVTASTEELRKSQKNYISKHNQLVRAKIVDIQERRTTGIGKRPPIPPLLLHIALPGSINRQLDVEKFLAGHEKGFYDYEATDEITNGSVVEVIGKIHPGVIDVSRQGRTIPAAIRLETDDPFLLLGDQEYALTDELSIRSVARAQAMLLHSRLPETVFAYDAVGGNKRLPVKD